MSIPYFVILSKWGTVVTDNAYTLVCQIGVGLFEYLDYKQFGGKERVERQHMMDSMKPPEIRDTLLP